MGISSGVGIGSGLDIGSIVQKLVAADGQPVTDFLNLRQQQAQTRLSALGTLKGALSAFQIVTDSLKTSTVFDSMTVTSANSSVLSATAGTGAVAANYSIAVTALAQAQSKVTTAGYAGTDTFGSGTLSIGVGAVAPVTVNITAGVNDSLSGIASAVNSANTGVTASVVNVTGGSKLIFTSNSTGATNTISVTGTSTLVGTVAGGLTAFNGDGLTTQTAAQDASFTVNGMAATSTSNTVSSVISSVTLNLNSTSATAVNLSVALDTTAISKKVGDFVTAYNNVQNVMKSLGGYDSGTKTGGDLLGDATLRTVSEQIRRDVGNPVTTATGNYNTLFMLGVQVDRYGVMSVNQTTLSTAITSSSSSLKGVFSSTDGVAVRLSNDLKTYLQAGGLFDSQTTSLNKTLSDVSSKRLDLENRLSLLQANLQKQFYAMDQLVGSMNTTGNYLSQQLSKLPGFR